MNEYSRDALYHHGVIGMKWGIRRYQPYGLGYDPQHVGKYVGDRSAKSYKKALKSLQRDKDNLEAWGAKQQHFRDKYQYRANKAEAKGKTAKAQKYRDEANPFEKDVDEIRTSRDRVESTIQSIIEDAGRNGIRVDAKNNTKFVSAMTAGERALQVLGFVGGGVLYRAGATVSSRKFKTRQMTDDEKMYERNKANIDKMQEDGYQPNGSYRSMSKQVKTKNGETVEVHSSAHGYSEDRAVAQKMEKSIDTIEKNAVKKWVDDNYEHLKDWVDGPVPTKEQVMKSMKLSSVYTNGYAYLKFDDGKDLIGGHFATVEFDPKTGKMSYSSIEG